MTTAPSPRVEPIFCQLWCKHGDGHLGEWLAALASAVIPALQVCGAVAERGECRGRVEQVVRRPGAVEVLTGPAVEVAGSGLRPLVVDDAALACATGVVLEVSATPYLYSLRFYDGLRQDSQGSRRAVHTDLAFQNLDRQRRGSQVSVDPVPGPREVRSGMRWREEVPGEVPGELSDMFFEVWRFQLDPDFAVREHTAGRFHVLNGVEGARITIITSSGALGGLVYAETAVVPAAVGAYDVKAWGPKQVRVVKESVR